MYNYYSQPQTNRELIESLKINWVLNTPAIEKALLKYDRKLFIPTEFAAQSYLDQPIEIGSGQTISQPFTLAFMLELLNVQSGDKILDIGSGSCWSTALLAGLAGEKSQVTGLEIRKSVWKFGSKNLQQFTLNNVRNILAVDGQVGLSKKKFDRILVSAAAQTLSEE
ncbi:MAG: class I SAM-dependent methyltransferase, partial [bacterium]